MPSRKRFDRLLRVRTLQLGQVRSQEVQARAVASFAEDTARREAPAQEPSSPEAEVARAACAQWRRRPFQAIDADDLQPIAALFREAVDTRAASRFRYGSR